MQFSYSMADHEVPKVMEFHFECCPEIHTYFYVNNNAIYESNYI